MSLNKPEQSEDAGGALRSLPILRRARWAVIGLGAALLFLALVFPPWAASYYDGAALVHRDPAGIHWILSPPRRSDLTVRDILEMAQRGEGELARRITADMADAAGAESWRNTWLLRLGLRMEHEGKLLPPSYAVDFERLSLHLGGIALGMAVALIAIVFFTSKQCAPTSPSRGVTSSTEVRQERAGRAWRRLFGFALLAIPGCWTGADPAASETNGGSLTPIELLFARATRGALELQPMNRTLRAEDSFSTSVAESAGGVCALGILGLLVGGVFKLLGGTLLRGVVLGMGLGGAFGLAGSWYYRPVFGANAGGWTGYTEGLVLGLVFLLIAWDLILGDHVNRRGPARES